MFEAVELEGNYLQSRNKVRRIGTEERPEWGASPAKPSKLSELKPREKFYFLECVRSLLLVVSPDSQ